MGQKMEIRADLIRPFLEATLNVLSTMAFVEAKPGSPFLKKGLEPAGDVSGIIGMAGADVSGSMALIFPEKVILKIVSSMLGEEFTEISPDVMDCVGELTNIISGGARAGLAKLDLRFEMATPTMIQGSAHLVEHKSSAPVICIPFEMDEGIFYIEATFAPK